MSRCCDKTAVFEAHADSGLGRETRRKVHSAESCGYAVIVTVACQAARAREHKRSEANQAT